MPKTIVKDKATAEFAARNLEKGAELPGQVVEPNAPKVKSTAEKLFPEFVTDDGTVVNRPVRPFEDKTKSLPASATPAPEIPTQTPPTTAPTIPSYLKTDEMTGKMVKVKVDGIESDVPAESLVKNYQLERHLNAQLMTLAEERRKLEADRAVLLRQPAPIPETPKPGKAPEPVKRSDEVQALEAQLLQMQEQMAGLQQTLVPQIQEAGIKRVEKMVKERIGTDDFRTYFEKIRDNALAEASKPEVSANPQARAYYDSDAYYFQSYQEMKLRELTSKPPASIPAQNQNTPALVTQSGAPVVINNSGRPVSIPSIESSGGVPSKADPTGNWAARAQQAFDMARQTGRTEDWVAYYKLKAEAS